MDQVTILHNLSKQEAILEIQEATTTGGIDVAYLRVSAANPRGRIDSHECIPGPVTVHLVSGYTIGVVEALNHFWAQDVIPISDKETGFVVESCLIFRNRLVVS